MAANPIPSPVSLSIIFPFFLSVSAKAKQEIKQK
jgi:hypothetical protein